jgi:hypothetical protein
MKPLTGHLGVLVNDVGQKQIGKDQEAGQAETGKGRGCQALEEFLGEENGERGQGKSDLGQLPAAAGTEAPGGERPDGQPRQRHNKGQAKQE